MLISLSVFFLLTGALSIFHGKDLPSSAIYSGWYKVQFQVQYMMDKKAVLFQDIKQERDILNSSAPLVMKQVQNFDKYLETIL